MELRREVGLVIEIQGRVTSIRVNSYNVIVARVTLKDISNGKSSNRQNFEYIW